MNSGNQLYRWLLALLSAATMVATVGLPATWDHVDEICVYGGKIDYCAPDGS